MQKNTVLTVPATPVAMPGAAAAGVASPKWMWVAIGGLGACVVALATVLVVERRSAPPTEAAVAQATPAALAAPAVASSLQAAPGAAARWPALPRSAAPPSPAWPQTPAARGDVARQPAGTPVAQRAASICSTCGRVESVQAIEQAAPATGVGAVAGGVLGAVVGNQIGKGNGRTAATVLGAVGGGYAGHEIETHPHPDHLPGARAPGRRQQPRLHPLATACRGHPVVLQGKGFRVADEGAMPQAQQPQPAPQYQTVSQPGYVAMQQ
jgi:hypothetical protein